MTGNTLRTHICLISDQAVPNLIPALDPQMRPARVIQLVSPDMETRAQWLSGVLRSQNVRVERWDLQDAWDIEHVQQRVLELLEKERDELVNNTIALNVTGGTKPMSIAAYEVCRVYDLPIFYVHPEQDRIIWLHPAGRKSQDLADRVKLEPFLQAQGAQLDGEPGRNVPNPGALDVGHEIVNHIDRFQKAIGRLNWLAAGAGRSLRSESIEGDNVLEDLIDLFEKGGYLQRMQRHLLFADEKARFFVNGGWLECLVFDAVRRIRKQDEHIQDIAYGVNVKRQQRGQNIPNELDVAFLRNNRLHIIECKTMRFQGKGEDSAGAETLYKLDSLRDLMGGLKARAMLVSYRDLPDYDRTRAQDLGIQVCAGTQLRHLSDRLKAFIR